MKRSYRLSVDRLEDRCVPSADPLQTTATITPPPTTTTYVAPTTTTYVAPTTTTAPTYPTIDPYLIDPNTAPPPPAPSTDSGGTAWLPPPPTAPTDPIADPFWY